MSTKAKADDFKKIADEALFQLACGQEFGGWMATLIKAIQLDLEHKGGRNIKGLADLAQYLADTHQADVDNACRGLSADLVKAGGSQ